MQLKAILITSLMGVALAAPASKPKHKTLHKRDRGCLRRGLVHGACAVLGRLLNTWDQASCGAVYDAFQSCPDPPSAPSQSIAFPPGTILSIQKSWGGAPSGNTNQGNVIVPFNGQNYQQGSELNQDRRNTNDRLSPNSPGTGSDPLPGSNFDLDPRRQQYQNNNDDDEQSRKEEREMRQQIAQLQERLASQQRQQEQLVRQQREQQEMLAKQRQELLARQQEETLARRQQDRQEASTREQQATLARQQQETLARRLQAARQRQETSAEFQAQQPQPPPYEVTSAASRYSAVMPQSAYSQSSYPSRITFRHGVEAH